MNILVLLTFTVLPQLIFKRLPTIFRARTRGRVQLLISSVFPVGYAIFMGVLKDALWTRVCCELVLLMSRWGGFPEPEPTRTPMGEGQTRSGLLGGLTILRQIAR
jgi:hypothetical protein